MHRNCFILTVLLAGSVAGAATTAPRTSAASAPASAPATTRAAIDRSTPKALIRSFYSTGGELSEQTLRLIFHAATPAEQKVLDSMVQINAAGSRLRAAMAEKLGVKEPIAAGSPGAMDAQSFAELDAWVEKIDGDRAVVQPPHEADGGMQCVKVDGQWKLSIAGLVGKPGNDPAFEKVLEQGQRMQIEVIDSIVADLRAGKITTQPAVMEELRKRLEARMTEAVRQALPATATAPAPGAAGSPERSRAN